MIKKVWLNPFATNQDMFHLCLESAMPNEPYTRVTATEMVFPTTPTPDFPLRHTLSLGLLEMDDIVLLRDTLGNFLADNGVK